MNYKISGERGFIGQHLVHRLQKEDDLSVPTFFHMAGKFHDDLVSSNITYGAKILEDMDFQEIKKIINAGTYWGPETLYGATKRAFECILDYYRIKGIQVITLRLSNVYGPGQNRLLLPQLIEASNNNTAFKIRSSPYKQVNFIYINDVIEAFMIAARSSSLNGTYTVYADEPVTLGEFIEAFREYRPLKVEWGNEMGVAPTDTYRLPDWTPKISLREGLRRCL